MKKRGFTLIEIVIALAIGGLIIAIVFLALTGAQKSRRDSQRQHDLARLATQLEVYAGANLGAYPTTGGGPNGFLGGFVASYLPGNFNDPLANAPYYLEIGFGSPCDSSAPPASANGPGSISYDVPGANGSPFKLRMCLEKGEYDIGT